MSETILQRQCARIVANRPWTGDAMKSGVTFVEATPEDWPEIAEMFDIVCMDRSYLPGVSSGAVPFTSWYRRKGAYRVLLAFAPDGVLIGHAALRLNGMTPDGEVLPQPFSWEISMIAVRPGYRGCHVAYRLIEQLAASAREGVVWISARDGSPGVNVLASLGWVELQRTSWGPQTPGSIHIPRSDA